MRAFAVRAVQGRFAQRACVCVGCVEREKTFSYGRFMRGMGQGDWAGQGEQNAGGSVLLRGLLLRDMDDEALGLQLQLGEAGVFALRLGDADGGL